MKFSLLLTIVGLFSASCHGAAIAQISSEDGVVVDDSVAIAPSPSSNSSSNSPNSVPAASDIAALPAASIPTPNITSIQDPSIVAVSRSAADLSRSGEESIPLESRTAGLDSRLHGNDAGLVLPDKSESVQSIWRVLENSPATFQPLVAQTPPNTLPPGSVDRPIDLAPLPDAEPTPPPQPSLSAPETDPLPSQRPAPTSDLSVTVEKIDVLGSTVFSEEELQATVEPFTGKAATFEDLLAIRSAITRLYTENGYATSGAFLPVQDLTSGNVKIQVVEGALERIELQGLKRLRQFYVRSRLKRATGAPLNVRKLEEALQLLQLNPLLSTVQAELSAGSAPGLSVLTVTLKEAPAFNVTLFTDNSESPSVGEVRGGVSLSHDNLAGFGDRFSAETSFTAGLDQVQFAYGIPLNAWDGTLNLAYSRNHSRIVEAPFDPLDIKGRASTFSIGFRQPIVRKPNEEFALSLSADFRESQTFVLGDIPFSFSEGPEDGLSRVTVLRFSQDWVKRSSRRVLAARSQMSFGLDLFGATINETGTDGRFFSWLGQFQWVESLHPRVIFLTRLGMQFSNDSLLPLEQFSIGGPDTVRGYRRNQRVTDNGFFASAEFRITLVREPDGIGTIQLAPFFDYGTVWNHTDETNPNPRTLASLGVGLRWELAPHLTARLDWGAPLYSTDGELDSDTFQDNGIFFSLEVRPF